MTYNPDRHHRRSIRLKGYDYTRPGAYYVTICAARRGQIFGDVRAGQVFLSPGGLMASDNWLRLPTKFNTLSLDASVLMPDHLHGILVIGECVDTGGDGGDGGDGGGHMGPPLLGDIIGWFKTMTTNAYIRGVRDLGWPPLEHRLWQRGYFEHIVRDPQDMARIRAYIAQNPTK